jgi:gluconolactonase
MHRRKFLATSFATGLAGIAAAQQQNVSPTPTPRNYANPQPIQYPDPDIIALDRRFQKYIIGNTPIQRLYFGTFWSEGPAWSGVGRFLVWSDVPNNRQMRFLEEDSHVSEFRKPTGNSNGNTFDYEGRQLSCEHIGRRVARYELNGTVTTIAEHFQGKRLNSPNDIVVHPDGSIWFTDPTYGIVGNYEGNKAASEIKPMAYRVDGKSGQMTVITDELDQPNGICFSPDYKKVYICDTGAAHNIRVWDLDGSKVRNGKQYAQFDIPGTNESTIADGIRCDVDGNLWCGARPGVQIWTPNAERIGMIRLPETCANVCFGGDKRNRLFMAASESLYSVYVGTSGAHIA